MALTEGLDNTWGWRLSLGAARQSSQTMWRYTELGAALPLCGKGAWSCGQLWQDQNVSSGELLRGKGKSVGNLWDGARAREILWVIVVANQSCLHAGWPGKHWLHLRGLSPHQDQKALDDHGLSVFYPQFLEALVHGLDDGAEDGWVGGRMKNIINNQTVWIIEFTNLPESRPFICSKGGKERIECHQNVSFIIQQLFVVCCCVPGTTLGAEGAVVSKTRHTLALMKVTV